MSQDRDEAVKAGADDLESGLRRREFLQLLGGAFAALSAGGCKFSPPQEKVIPALAPPEDVVPGKSLWYAVACPACPAACGALAKVRDGRPIKLEGNPEHPVSRGGLCARGHASVLDLYDSRRFAGPLIGGKDASWDEADAEVAKALSAAAKSGKKIRLLTSTWASPTARAWVARFLARHPGAAQVTYDALSQDALAEAHRALFGARRVPSYHLEKAKVIVSVDADFLGSWLSPIQFMKDWAVNRRPDAEFDLMSWHAQFESRLSLTGANADLRAPIKPSERYGVLAGIGRRVAARTGWTGPLPAEGATSVSRSLLQDAADALVAERRRAVVLCGSDDLGEQLLAAWINHMIGAYESGCADFSRPFRLAEGGAGLAGLIDELRRGEVGVLIVRGANPAYDHPLAADFRDAAVKAGLVVDLASRPDETTALSRVVCPEPHSLERWEDHDAHAGVAGLSQPALSPLYATRPAVESLARWSGRKASAYELTREHWKAAVFPRQKKHRAFEPFWEEAVQAGFAAVSESSPASSFSSSALSRLKAPASPEEGLLELCVHASPALGAGEQANNPWLQELPDPITKQAWGNAACFSPADAARLGLVEGRLVRLSAGGASASLPALIQPGQAPGTVSASLGYGRPNAGEVAANFPTRKMLPIDQEPGGGADLFPLAAARAVKVEALPTLVKLAKTQRYDHLSDPLLGERRPFARETTLQDYARDPRAGNPPEAKEGSLWKEHEYEGHRWGMAIDLNACTGCSGCVVSCGVENNVPVVGKSEVEKSREMHWLRLDRYYEGTPGNIPESPEVSFQPMLCQHCGNAPCETVCPVLATVHSSEGLNMQVYNRCVGTRYCANNCPYKTRRFNWFDYAHTDLTQNLALNPDVTVRTRGIMEKCSFCVQRIYEGKAQAKVEGRALKDGEVRPACAQSCPADAIVFGDLNDPESKVAKAAGSPRAYRVLPELGVQPSVFYLTKVRNKKV